MPDVPAIEFQLSLIERELKDVELLLQAVKLRVPDSIELRALGSVLQTFYNGLESCLVLLQEKPIAGHGSYHLKILENAQSFLSEETYDFLDQYRRFRHKYRHGYGFSLNWEMMKPLVMKLDDLFLEFQREIKQSDTWKKATAFNDK